MFNIRTTLAGSPDSMVLATLHTLKSPSRVCVASISVFCFEDEVCHANEVIGEGDKEEVVSVYKMVNGVKVATNIEPLLYL